MMRNIDKLVVLVRDDLGYVIFLAFCAFVEALLIPLLLVSLFNIDINLILIITEARFIAGFFLVMQSALEEVIV